jgi:hypothetical protein
LQRGRQRRNDIGQAARFRKRRGLGRDHQDAGHRGIVAEGFAGVGGRRQPGPRRWGEVSENGTGFVLYFGAPGRRLWMAHWYMRAPLACEVRRFLNEDILILSYYAWGRELA